MTRLLQIIYVLVVEQLWEFRLVDGFLIVGLQWGCLIVAQRNLTFHGQRVEEFIQTVLNEIMLEIDNSIS